MVVEHSKELHIDVEHPAAFQNNSALITRLKAVGAKLSSSNLNI